MAVLYLYLFDLWLVVGQCFHRLPHLPSCLCLAKFGFIFEWLYFRRAYLQLDHKLSITTCFCKYLCNCYGFQEGSQTSEVARASTAASHIQLLQLSASPLSQFFIPLFVLCELLVVTAPKLSSAADLLSNPFTLFTIGSPCF